MASSIVTTTVIFKSGDSGLTNTIKSWDNLSLDAIGRIQSYNIATNFCDGFNTALEQTMANVNGKAEIVITVHYEKEN